MPMIDAVSLRSTQRGFSLLIGLVLLLGMTILALSLSSSGLFQTKLAYQSQQDVENFQTNDGLIDQLLSELEAGNDEDSNSLISQLLKLQQGESIARAVCDSNDTGCRGRGEITLTEMENPCENDALIRKLSSSNGKTLCRYFEASFSHSQRHDALGADSKIRQGLFDVTYSAATRNGLAL